MNSSSARDIIILCLYFHALITASYLFLYLGSHVFIVGKILTMVVRGNRVRFL